MKSSGEQKVGGAWRNFTGKVKEAWGVLTDDDMDRYQGKRDQFIGFVQQKTGETRDAIARKLDKWSSDVKYGWSSPTTGER